MNHIDIIKSNSSFDLAETAKAIINMVGIDSVKYAILKDVSVFNVNEFPLVIACSSNKTELTEFEIRIRVLPLGYEGNEAHQLLEVLKYAGFEFDEKKFSEDFGFMMLEKKSKETTGG